MLKKLDIEKPNIIMITGDYINDKGKRKKEMLEFAAELLKRAPVYYITGNHEHRLDCF
ncbi:MAG: metallophosphoesterase [Anaerotruncus sp.]|nr:MAG: metallophosphoesterase [Anaerotruncus sp.]